MKRLKKIKTKLILLTFLASMYVLFCGYKVTYDESQQKVYDDADYFTDEEEEQLELYCREVAKEIKLDVAIHTTESFDGKDRVEYSDDFYDEMNFGYDQAGSGILFVINQKAEQRYIDTKGIAIRYFSDDDIQEMGKKILEYIDDGKYAESAEEFVGLVYGHVEYFNSDNYDAVKPWFDGDYKDYKDFYNEHVKELSFLQKWPGSIIIGIVLSGIVVLFIASGQKAKMTVTSETYIDNNQKKIHQQSDVFIRRTTTKHKIEKDSSSGGGGGSFHSSSSGSSHGGGGF